MPNRYHKSLFAIAISMLVALTGSIFVTAQTPSTAITAQPAQGNIPAQQDTAAATAAAHLTLERRTIDLGVLTGDTIATATFTIHNDGNAPLVFTSVFSDCNCTVADYPRETIAPGTTAAVGVSFNTRGRLPGAFRKAVRLRTNATNHTVAAYVTGTVARPIRQE